MSDTEANHHSSHSFVVAKHTSVETTDKEPTFKVVLKSLSPELFKARVEIIAETNQIFQTYPLTEHIELCFTRTQQTLDETEN